MLDIMIMRDSNFQEELLRAGGVSKENFMQVLSKNPTSLRISIKKIQEVPDEQLF